MPRISVLATGGTISSRSGPHGAVATDSAARVVGRSDGVAGLRVEPINVLRKNSFNATMADLADIAEAVRAQLARPEVDGVVVTHGTDTLEETAFLVDLVHDDPRPVVFTGAQRSADHAYPDGPANLDDAIAVASSDPARGAGALVAFGGRLFAARGVYKAHTLALDPFRARGGGPIGSVVDGTVRITSRPVRAAPLPPPTANFATATVAATLTYPGSDTGAFDRAVADGARGVVVVGTGAGNPNSDLVRAIGRATDAGVVVALGTRVPEGPTVPIYGGGGAHDARAAGAVMTGGLPASQVRVLLALLLDHYPADETRARLAHLCGGY